MKKRQKVLEGFDSLVISLYAKGNSLKDISETIEEIYSIQLSSETISNMTKSVSEEVEVWQNRELKKCYPFVYVDCLYCYVKEDLRSIKKAASKWCEIFEELKSRGVEDILFISMDGLTGFPDAVESVFPQAIMQRCVVHISRNIYTVTAKKMLEKLLEISRKYI